MPRRLLSSAFATLAQVARRPPRWLILTLLVLGIEVSYVFIITAGTFTDWPTWNTNYEFQAEGFRAGHLHLSVEPPPELLAQRNPWDYANRPLWFWDASLHGSHYYLYWGPLPALVLAAVKTVFRMNFVVGDQYPLFAFYTIYLITGAVMLDRMARRLFERLPLWLVGLGVVVFAYANPTPFMIATPGIYEAAIIGGQAFLLLGLLFAFDAVHASDARHSRRALLLAGVAWGLGMATRVSIGPAVALILAATVIAMNPALASWRGDALKQRARELVIGAAPIAAVVASLLAYNKARFDDWFNFGIKNQLSTMGMRYSLAYVFPNLEQYWFRPLLWSPCRFPFFKILASERGFPSWMTLPKDYWTPEPLGGIVVAAPWAWLVPVALFFAARVVLRAWREHASGGDGPDARLRMTLWCLFAFVVMATVTGLPTIRIFLATMRYIADVMTGVLLLTIWGAWALYTHFADRAWPRRLVAAGLVGLAAVTLIIGLALGTQGYNLMFEQHNPKLYLRMMHALSRC
jgi:hypothetical protein